MRRMLILVTGTLLGANMGPDLSCSTRSTTPESTEVAVNVLIGYPAGATPEPFGSTVVVENFGVNYQNAVALSICGGCDNEMGWQQVQQATPPEQIKKIKKIKKPKASPNPATALKWVADKPEAVAICMCQRSRAGQPDTSWCCGGGDTKPTKLALDVCVRSALRS